MNYEDTILGPEDVVFRDEVIRLIREKVNVLMWTFRKDAKNKYFALVLEKGQMYDFVYLCSTSQVNTPAEFCRQCMEYVKMMEASMGKYKWDNDGELMWRRTTGQVLVCLRQHIGKGYINGSQLSALQGLLDQLEEYCK
jgi:hypothetical protein